MHHLHQKELPNKRGNLKSSCAEVTTPTYHSNATESEGKIM